jgi:hypothetical protein
MRARLSDALASGAVLLIGVAALFAMAPAFLLFIPIVLAAWLVARLGFVPRGLHPEHASVRLTGSREAEPLAAARAEITFEERHREDGIRLLDDLLQRLSSAVADGAGAEGAGGTGARGPALAVEHASDGGPGEPLHATTPAELSRAVRDRLILLREPGGVLAASWAGSTASPAVPPDWRRQWSRACARLDAGAPVAAEIRADVDSAVHVRCDLLGDGALLEDALVSWARDLRRDGDVECVTSGWVREGERRTWAERRGARAAREGAAGQ